MSKRTMEPFISRSVTQTEAAGKQLGLLAQRGWTIGLSGDLGAGKTAWARGFARGLGYLGRVQSPTFALLNEYVGGRLQMFHADLYRLQTADEVWSAGLDEYVFEPDGVAVVEWWERAVSSCVAGNASPSRTLRDRWPTIRIQIETIDESTRRITYDNSWT